MSTDTKNIIMASSIIVLILLVGLPAIFFANLWWHQWMHRILEAM